MNQRPTMRPAVGDRAGPLLLALACAYLLYELWPPPPPIDDAFISLRYAANLVGGQGLVWNPGERVEGITNLLWTLLLAAPLALGVGGSVALYALSTASALAALASTYALARALLPAAQRGLAGLAPLLLVTSSAFAVWARSGLETPLLACVAAQVLLAIVRDRPWAMTAWLIVAGLLRPDAWLLAPPALWLGIASGAGRMVRGGGPDGPEGPLARFRRAWPYAAVFGLSVLGVSAFRLAYYGTPLPNTFHAKVGGIPWVTGFTYVGLFLLSGPLLYAPFAFEGLRGTTQGGRSEVAPADDSLRVPRARQLAQVVVAQGGLHTAYVLAVGGDVFPFGRFLVVLLPGLIALGLLGALRVPRWFSVTSLLVHVSAVWAGAPVATFAYLALALLGIAALVLGGVGPVRLATATGSSTLPARLAVGGQGRGFFVAVVCCALVLAVVERRALPGKRFATRFSGITNPSPGRHQRIEVLDRFNRFALGRADRMVEQIVLHPPRPPAIAALAIGRLGYRLPYPIIDVLGLTDPVVARGARAATDVVVRSPAPANPDPVLPGHHRSNAAYVLSRRPGLILIPRKPPIALPAVDDLLAHPVFQADYVFDPSMPGYRRHLHR